MREAGLTNNMARIVVAFLAATATTHACKYNVRDAGFVDFEPAPYRLVVHTNEATAGAKWPETLRHIVASAWLDANVELEFGNRAEVARASVNGDERGATLDGVTTRLVAPDGRALERPLPLPPNEDALWSLVEDTVESPLRTQLQETLVESFAAILISQGPDAEENARAKAAADGAVERFKTRMPRLPKPVKRPPSVITLRTLSGVGENQGRRAESMGDRIARWSLGLATGDQNEAEVVVVYGRGRRSGPPLRGPEITETALLEVLTILGQDCECDLDRSWLRGPLMPMVWDTELQESVVQELGFDAESPMVKTEIARIVARGPTPGAHRVSFSQDSGDLFGYSETGVEVAETASDELAPEAELAESAPQTETNAPSSVSPPVNPAATAGVKPVARMSITFIFLIGAVIVGVALVFLFSGKSD